MFGILGLVFLFPIVTRGIDSISGHLRVTEHEEGGSKTLAESSIGLWLQQQQLVKRVCHRETADQMYQGIGERFGVENCQISMAEASNKLTTQHQVCPGNDACTATSSEVTTIRTLDGVRDVTSALNCTCVSHETGCRRMPSERLFYKGTKYEKRVDVGQCIGKCAEHGSRHTKCKPTSSKTVTVTGPNGAKCVSVIQSCACERKCHRVSHKEAFQVQLDNRTITEVIDVGRCVGTCSGHVKGNCLYWVKKRDETGSGKRNCVIRTKSRPKGCYPESTRVQNLGAKTVTLVETCACH